MATKKQTAEVPENPAPIMGQAAGTITAWGPFDDYTYVTTPYGDYGLEAGLILTFEAYQRFNKDTGEMEIAQRPIRTRATQEQLDQYGVSLDKQKPNQQILDAVKQGRAPQAMEITINGEGTFPGVVKQKPVKEDH